MFIQKSILWNFNHGPCDMDGHVSINPIKYHMVLLNRFLLTNNSELWNRSENGEILEWTRKKLRNIIEVESLILEKTPYPVATNSA